MRVNDLKKYGSLKGLTTLSGEGAGGHAHHGHGGAGHPPGHGGATSKRTTEHRGHTIVIETTYKVTIDGKELGMPFDVDDDGIVSCHIVPTYGSPSALDVGRRIVDAYPNRYPERRSQKPRKGGR